MGLVQVAAPPQVAGSAVWVRRARDGPAADVVGAGRQQQLLAGVGPQAAHPLGDEPGVERFLLVGVLGVGGVDGGDGPLEARLGHARRASASRRASRSSMAAAGRAAAK